MCLRLSFGREPWASMKKRAIEPAASRFAIPTRAIPSLAITPGIASGAMAKKPTSMIRKENDEHLMGCRECSSTS